ncbi:glycosyltransferase family protein [Aquibacillus albus]|uniref:Uncharacterized protein (TIGR00661 family) n=1 Tax=Aquibacillus albus TaxID=1168171 RepID=A0ABS2N5T3_9BACI|nr:glycosyltransferase family protein [Aquibacillus albus]MBM7573501.1 uncharacterized protein (TIGR00661 family) [Aquibacillus albus]
MKTIAYYISDYGFGHASRSIAVIRATLKHNKDIKIIVCHSFALDFLKDSLKDLNVEFRKLKTDIGYFLQTNNIFPDPAKIEREYIRFIDEWEIKLENEKDFLSENKVNLVISDISPLPFIPAKQLGIPSVGISNFTWYTAYKGMVVEKYLEYFKKSYVKMDFFFSLAGENEQQLCNKKKHRFNFLARNTEKEEVERIIDSINPDKNKTVVYFGLGMKVDINDLHSLELWNSDDCVFLVSSNLEIDKPNVYKIPKQYTESQNYVAASDIVISKAGWSTVSEAILNHKPLIVLNRSFMNEDGNTIDYLKKNNYVKLINWDELKKIRIDTSLLTELKKQHTGKLTNDVSKVSNKILHLL